EAAASGDWLLRSLVVLVAAAMVALLLAAVSELPPAETAVSGMRTRLASKGLSSSRIDLGRERAAAPARGNGVSYRDGSVASSALLTARSWSTFNGVTFRSELRAGSPVRL